MDDPVWDGCVDTDTAFNTAISIPNATTKNKNISWTIGRL